jgi:8-oxo-dGTP diphosphatase
MRVGLDFTGIGVGAVVISPDRRVLLLHLKDLEGSDLWSIPGGQLLIGESPEEALDREVQEETGIVVCLKELLGHITHNGKEGHWISFVYLVTLFKGEPRVSEPQVHNRVEWWPLHHLPNLTEISLVSMNLLPEDAKGFFE